MRYILLQTLQQLPNSSRQGDMVRSKWFGDFREICLLGASQGLTGSCLAQGFVYVVDCEGRTLQGWPLQMGEVQAQVAVGDINGDGALEVVAVDMHGNVAALSADGAELWERHIKSSVTQVAPAC